MAFKEYRLGEYKITEHISGDLSWEAHFGFAEYRQGRCFIKGQILFMGQAKGGSVGFLKGDFIDSIKKLPIWTTTKYYCLINQLFSCQTNQKATENDVYRWHMVGGSAIDQVPSGLTGSNFKLGKYLIDIKSKGLIQYKFEAGKNRQVVGEGFLMAGVLFLKQGKTIEIKPDDESFSAVLAKLAVWERSTFYSLASSLKLCVPSDEIHIGPSKYSKHILRKDTAKPSQSEKWGHQSKKLGLAVNSKADVALRRVSILANGATIIFKQVMVVSAQTAKKITPRLSQIGHWLWETMRSRFPKK